MNNDEVFMMLDGNGVEREARILNKIEVDGQDYLIYALSISSSEDSVYVAKIVKNGDDEEIVGITDSEERERVNSIVIDLINNL